MVQLNGGIVRLLLHDVSNDCKHLAIHAVLVHATHGLVGSVREILLVRGIANEL